MLKPKFKKKGYRIITDGSKYIVQHKVWNITTDKHFPFKWEDVYHSENSEQAINDFNTRLSIRKENHKKRKILRK